MPTIDIKTEKDPLTDRVIGAAIEVHRCLGPGLLESVYTMALEHELIARDIDVASEIRLPVSYKGVVLDSRLRIDLLVDESLVVELKSVEALLPVHYAQLLTYLRLGGFRRGLLINFNVARLADGIRRLVN